MSAPASPDGRQGGALPYVPVRDGVAALRGAAADCRGHLRGAGPPATAGEEPDDDGEVLRLVATVRPSAVLGPKDRAEAHQGLVSDLGVAAGFLG